MQTIRIQNTLTRLRAENIQLRKILRDEFNFTEANFDYYLHSERLARMDKISEIDTIIAEICKIVGVNEDVVLSKSQVDEAILARFACFYALKTKKSMTLKGIGTVFSLHYTTILHGISQFKKRAKDTQSNEYQLISYISCM